MSLILGMLLFIAGSVFTVALMSCFIVAKEADERQERMFASLGEDAVQEFYPLK